MIQTKVFSKPGIDRRYDLVIAKEKAERLTEYINQVEIQQLISGAHRLNASSGEIQAVFLDKAKELGFVSEKKGLFSNYQLRPDYYLPIGEGAGIIMEVERGKTIANNMDLLDIWKCHLCNKANILFLIIPQERHNSKGKSKIYDHVLRRVQSFFETESYIKVDALFVFGY